MNLFRDEVTEAKRRRLWGEVRIAQPPSLYVWTGVMSLICLCIFSALVFGRYTRKETVQGFLAPKAGVVQIFAQQNGRLSRLFVEEGTRVEAGAPLAEFSSDISSAGQGPVLDLQIAESDRQAVSLQMRRDAIIQGFADERRRLAEQVTAQARLRAILTSQKQVQENALQLALADEDRLRRLQSEGYAPNVEVDRRRREVLAERAALADLDSRISQTDAGSAELRSQLAAIPAREAQALSSIAGENSTLAQRRAELQVARGYVIRAPIAGTISGLQATLGLTPTATSPLMSISPRDSALEAHLLVPTRAAGFLEVGQVARIQVDAFPFQRFGFVEGRIRSIARTVVRPGDVAFPIEQKESVYLVQVTINRPYVEAYGERRLLQPGMVLTADIPIDRRRLWEQLFEPLLAAGKRST